MNTEKKEIHQNESQIDTQPQSVESSMLMDTTVIPSTPKSTNSYCYKTDNILDESSENLNATQPITTTIEEYKPRMLRRNTNNSSSTASFL